MTYHKTVATEYRRGLLAGALMGAAAAGGGCAVALIVVIEIVAR